MKVFLVFAHPNPHSLNAALKDHAVHKLQEAGHEVKISDLYAMNWKAVADGMIFLSETDPSR
jgi:NAD(P)H dehydrogenase (quinone)